MSQSSPLANPGSPPSPCAIQPHGALLAFGPDRRLRAHSANAATLLGDLRLPALGEVAPATALDGALAPAVVDPLFASPTAVAARELHAGDVVLDAVLHVHGGVLFVELQRRPSAPNATFASVAHSLLARVRAETSPQPLLDALAAAVRELTGAARTVVHRLLPDGSGVVVAEARAATLPPWLGRRHLDIAALTAGDPLVLADLHAAPVPLEPTDRDPRSGRTFELGRCALRVATPAQQARLQALETRAVAAFALTGEGGVWGAVLALDDRPLVLGADARLAADVVVATAALRLALLDERRGAERRQRADRAREQLADRARAAEDVVEALTADAPGLLDVVAADGAAVCLGGHVATVGATPPREQLRALAAALPAVGVVAAECAGEWPAGTTAPGWAGLLAAPFGAALRGHLVWFRRERIAAADGGPSAGEAAPTAPHAAGRCEPWSADERSAVQRLGGQLHTANAARDAQLERVHGLLLSVLGNDLRAPLHAISLSAAVLAETQNAVRTIVSSTARMREAIDTALDVTQLEQRGALVVHREAHDFHRAVATAVAETMATLPGCDVRLAATGDPVARFDRARVRQLVGALLDNAHRHGEAARPIHVRVGGDAEAVLLEIANHGPAIAPSEHDRLFAGLRPRAPGDAPRPGLGLFLCRAIARAHGGAIDVHSADGVTTFRVRLARDAAASAPGADAR